jgi:hypothetical protein
MFDHINLALYRLSTASDIIGNGAKAACPVDAAGKSECGVANVNGLFIVGAISVIMIIVGALRYVLSAGDGKNTAAAKDTILYAIVGLVIALSAYAIITFVTGHVK